MGPFKSKSQEEIHKHIYNGAEVPAEIIKMIIEETEFNQDIKVNFTGAWDRFGPIRNVFVSSINQGNGFESGLFISNDKGTFLYTPPFIIEYLPTKETLFLFKAGKKSIYINSIINVQ